MSIDVQQAGVAHVPVLVALHAACFDEPWDGEAFHRLLIQPGVVAFLATDDADDPLGFILMRAVADEAEILTVCVLPDARRRGVARALLTGAVAAVRDMGVHRVFLEVAVDNPGAQAFYECAGFAVEGRRKKYYKRADGRVDAVVMCLNLKTTS